MSYCLDYDRHVTYCEWLMNFVQTRHGMLNDVFYSDEAWFQLSGYVNSQNNHLWSVTHPHVRLETPLHPEKIGVWCAISEAKVVRPYFFTQTITSEVYLEITDLFIASLKIQECYN